MRMEKQRLFLLVSRALSIYFAAPFATAVTLVLLVKLLSIAASPRPVELRGAVA